MSKPRVTAAEWKALYEAQQELCVCDRALIEDLVEELSPEDEHRRCLACGMHHCEGEDGDGDLSCAVSRALRWLRSRKAPRGLPSVGEHVRVSNGGGRAQVRRGPCFVVRYEGTSVEGIEDASDLRPLEG